MTKYPVYITVASADPIRMALAVAVISYWSRHNQVSFLTVIDADAGDAIWGMLDLAGLEADNVIYIDRSGSQKQRHVVALDDARENGDEWAVLADSDILPHPSLSLHVAFDLARMARSAGVRGFSVGDAPYGMIAAPLPPDCYFKHIFADDQLGMMTSPVAEAGAVGGLRFVNTKIDPALLPDYEDKMHGYDCPFADGIRAQGMAVGYYTDAAPATMRATNLAGQFSVCWPHLGIPEAFPREGGAEG